MFLSLCKKINYWKYTCTLFGECNLIILLSFNFAFKFGTKCKFCFRYKGFTVIINRGFRIIPDGKLHKYEMLFAYLTIQRCNYSTWGVFHVGGKRWY